MQRRELFERHGSRLEQPAKIHRKIGDRRLSEYPGPGVVHVLQQPLHVRSDVGGRRRQRFEEWRKVGVGRNVAPVDNGCCAPEQRRLGRIAANAGERGKLLERRQERYGSRPA